MMRSFKDMVGIEYNNNLYADGEAEVKLRKTEKCVTSFEYKVEKLHKKIQQFEFNENDDDYDEDIPVEKLEIIKKLIQEIIEKDEEKEENLSHINEDKEEAIIEDNISKPPGEEDREGEITQDSTSKPPEDNMQNNDAVLTLDDNDNTKNDEIMSFEPVDDMEEIV